MKTNIYITIIIFLSVCYSAFTQSEINLLSNWDYKRKAKTYEKFNKVIASTNGYIIAVGETLGDSYKDLDGIFLVLDAEDGSQYLWKKFGGSGNQAFHSVVQNHDGTFTLVGYSQIGAKGDVDGWVVKLDLEGNVLFETKPQSMEGGNEELLDVAISDTGDILAIGMQKSNKSESIWAVNIGNEGIIKNFMMNNNFLGDVKSLTTATNGGFVLTGTTSEKNRNNPQDIWVTKIDKDGNDLWGGAKYFGDKGFQESKSITPTLQDGGFAIVGGTNSKGAGVSDIWVIKLDENGDLEWDKTFGGHAADVGAAITELSDGGLAVLGQTWSHMPRAQNSTLRLIIIDGRGNELDSENYLIIGGEGDEIAYSVVELLTNDNLVILGNTNPAKQDVFPTTYIGAITYKVLENNDSAGSKSDRFGSEQSGMLSLSSATLNDLNNNNFLESNERGYLELEITNTKTINLYNITANISGSNETSELGYWEKIKIGALKAGQKKKLFVPVYALGSLTAGTYEVNINLDVNGKYAASTKASIISNQPKPPYLAVQDSEFVPHSSPKAGQPIRFSVSLINKGGLPTPITEAYFELPKGVQALESQSIRIPAIKPEETYQLTFSFTYDQNFQRNVIDVLLQIKGQGLNSIFERYPLEIAPPALQNPNTRSSGDMMVWMSPDPDEQGSRTFATNDKDVDIKLKILTSRQLEKNRVSVYINGNKPQGQKADEVKLSSEDTALGRYNYQNKIRLKEGENKVKIVYHDENGNDFSSAELVFDYTPKDKPNLYVISIGVKHQDLEFTEQDANDFAKMYGQFRDDKDKRYSKSRSIAGNTR
ncbi:MAG: hypothetical protein IPJ74_08375 [Saprospiraceae bacterium]|nr:hypothetical protein [Saprospiraceae bacterium]